METHTLATALPLLEHPPEEVSAFTPEALLSAVKELRGLPHTRVPEVCVLEFDGDLTDKLARKGLSVQHETWACFHTAMGRFSVDGRQIGILARTIGGEHRKPNADRRCPSRRPGKIAERQGRA